MKKKRQQPKKKAAPATPGRSRLPLVVGAGIVLLIAILLGVWSSRRPRVDLDALLTAYAAQSDPGGLEIVYPPDEALFPPEIAPPTCHWRDTNAAVDTWLVVVESAPPAARMCFVSERPDWTPAPADWEEIKRRSADQPVALAVQGFRSASPRQILTGARVRLRTSRDPVGAPIFYREVNLPFLEAVKDPSRIRWRFGAIDSLQPPRVVLEKLPVCGNCHSFSQDGKVLGMDVDYANDKGSYVITSVAKEMALAASDIISWGDFRREDGQQTYGFLSQVSPDGQRVVSTVKDKSVFVARPNLAFSQLFFPLQGI